MKKKLGINDTCFKIKESNYENILTRNADRCNHYIDIKVQNGVIISFCVICGTIMGVESQKYTIGC